MNASPWSQPAAVRFAWDEQAVPNLMNKEGLPASTFRTDPPREWCPPMTSPTTGDKR
ncbi:MAG: hypothetical protein ABSF26_11520 [Thermoguttaceae bacterium]|jgi:hypothetical protein